MYSVLLTICLFSVPDPSKLFMFSDRIFSSLVCFAIKQNKHKLMARELYPKFSFVTSSLSTSIDFSFSKGVTLYRFKVQTAGLLLLGFSLVLPKNTFITVFSYWNNRLALQMVGPFLSTC